MLKPDYLRDGAAIYERSFAIIRAEADLSHFSAEEADIAVRMIHACGQVSAAEFIAFAPGLIAAARGALAEGAPILCDAEMVAHGVTRARLTANNDVMCNLRDPRVPELAAKLGTTRSAAALELWRDRLDGAVVAIGNAPTALFRLLEMLDGITSKGKEVIGLFTTNHLSRIQKGALRPGRVDAREIVRELERLDGLGADAGEPREGKGSVDGREERRTASGEDDLLHATVDDDVGKAVNLGSLRSEDLCPLAGLTVDLVEQDVRMLRPGFLGLADDVPEWGLGDFLQEPFGDRVVPRRHFTVGMSIPECLRLSRQSVHVTFLQSLLSRRSSIPYFVSIM